MSLFQQSVLNKYLKELDKTTVNSAFIKFKNYFGNSAIQQNIRDSKEEQYQEGFLRSLFVDILGYTPNPEPDFNLLTEKKNERDNKKADAAILLQASHKNQDTSNKTDVESTKVIAVIELKGTDTTDLSKVENQAFGYKNYQKGCVYVITSNFEKLRFYIDNAIDFEEFNLFTLTEERFQLLYLCLAKDNLLNNIPQKIKEASISREEHITKQLYSDYSAFKKFLFNNITGLNPQFDKLTLFKKTQKLLDRFLFILFAEDRQLLPPNSIREIINQWEKLKELDNYIPLYERFIKYFGYMNTGFKGKQYEIFAYNGGLFEPDEILDIIKIDDSILFDHTLKLCNYDFNTDVDVNILGHIFEHSLNEIEEIQRDLTGFKNLLGLSKRKKEGVFYTPKYITKYIVENTVGSLCTDKKKELGIDDIDFSKVLNFGKVKDKTIKKEQLDKIDTYRAWLLNLKICDPACGSGAFLNQALDFLINEHRKLDELKARITGSSIIFSDIENSILEHNIFGVDLNEEAVEIAKLSLWLKTARKGRKLSVLSNNIKCGNSLIDTPEIAGEKAFNWFLEFPQVFPFYRPKGLRAFETRAPLSETSTLRPNPEPGDKDYLDEVEEPSFSYKSGSKGFEKHGFDVIIGNPPYVFSREKISDSEKEFYSKNYISSKYQVNTYLLFIERTIRLLKANGLYSLIVPNAWLMVSSAGNLRRLILETSKLNEIVNLSGYSFSGVNVETIIINARKQSVAKNEFKVLLCQEEEFKFSHTREQESFSNNDGYEFKIFSDYNSDRLISKIMSGSEMLENVSEIKAGLQAYEAGKGNPKQSPEDVKNRPYDFIYKRDENTYPYLDGKDVNRYNIHWRGLFLKYGDNLAAPRTFNLFKDKRIIVREITGKYPKSIIAAYTEDIYLFNRSNIGILEKPGSGIDLKYLLAVLNSSLISYYFVKNTPKSVRQMFPKVILQDLRKFPIKIISTDQQKPFIVKVDKIYELYKDIETLKNTFLELLNANLKNVSIPLKLIQLENLDAKSFLDEFKKLNIKHSLSVQSEWVEFFIKIKSKINNIFDEIKNIEDDIDTLVYKLYGLDGEEIKIINTEFNVV